jgi:outer membrane protein OmpA-like peptidoglycan-associated protein
MGVVIVALVTALMILSHRTPPGDELVVVLPGPNGRGGTVVVERGGETAILNQAYASSRIVSGGGPQAQRLTESDVRREFGSLLAALPGRPKSFLLYFLEGKDEFTPESQVELERMLSELRQRGAPDVVVIGHTDRVGNLQSNDRLSLQRAERVRTELVKLGIAESRIQIAGRGEREPLVPTADEVSEPRNRRVEISVR